MLVTILIASLLLAVVVHELGHAFAMRECGIPVERISLLGIGTERMCMITLPIKSKMFPGTKWVVHPFIFGAYVKPDEKAMLATDDKDEAYISGMGPHINFIFAAIMYGCMISAWGIFVSSEIYGSLIALLSLILTPIVVWILWRYRRFVCERLLLALGAVFLVIAIHHLLGLAFKDWQYLSGGPLSFFVVLSKVAARVPENSVEALVYIFKFTATMSLFLGLLNLIPIPPLDGGRIVMRLLKKFFSDPVLGFFERFGHCLIVALMVLALHNDLAVIDGYLGLGYLHF